MPERLSTFGVRGFRALDHLDIKGLGAVNLFVGKNNTGKTTLLEAIRIYLSSDPRLRIYNLLTSREEFRSSRKIRAAGLSLAEAGGSVSFEALFSGRPDIEQRPEFHLGPFPDDKVNGLTVKLLWLRREEVSEELGVRYHIVEDASDNSDLLPGLSMRISGKMILAPLDRSTRVLVRRRLQSEFDQDVVYLPSSGMTMREIGETWDTIALTDEEDDVVNALKIIAPDLDKIVLVQSPQENSQRMLMAKLSSFAQPVPFKSLGEGTIHLLSLVLAMIQARNGVVLLDEVENGIHYSVQKSMWDLILNQAKSLNVQVFATTHSWDCVTGFQAAAASDAERNARLFRLERHDDQIKAVGFTAEEVAVATSEGIEIR